MACPLLAWEKAKDIEGWFEREEALILNILCDGPWCEVGAWKGRSTVMLAATGHPGWVVDWFRGSPEHAKGTDTYEEFRRNIDGHSNVTVVRARFEDGVGSVPRRLRFLHLDADHSYEGTKRAFDLYAPKVAEGGYIAFHDAAGGAWPEVEQFVSDLPLRRFAVVDRLMVFRV